MGSFTLYPVDKKPEKKRVNKRGSKYQPIIDAFLDSGHRLVRVEIEGKDPNYVAGVLRRLIKENGQDQFLKATVRNNDLYLENTLMVLTDPNR